MSRNASGTYSSPAGNPVISGTTISSTVHNATVADVATELTDSLCRSGKGAMLAPLPLTNGSAAAPSLTFDTDADTGLYRVGANNLGLAVAGAKVVDVAAGTVGVTGAVTATAGVTATQSVSNTAGTTSTGNGSGAGVVATGGATGKGVTGTGGGTAVGGSFANGTAATGATPQAAVELTNGHLLLSGTAPNSTVGVTNALTSLNLIKAWGLITLNTSVSPTLTSGFNVASVAASATAITVTIANDMANANYAPFPVSDTGTTDRLVQFANKAAGSFDIVLIAASDGATIQDPRSGLYDGDQIAFLILGAQ